MSKTVESSIRKHVTKRKCHHHWVIDSPDGPTSTGICKYCGAAKEFDNYLPFSSWDEETAKQKRRSKSKRAVSRSDGGDT